MSQIEAAAAATADAMVADAGAGETQPAQVDHGAAERAAESNWFEKNPVAEAPDDAQLDTSTGDVTTPTDEATEQVEEAPQPQPGEEQAPKTEATSPFTETEKAVLKRCQVDEDMQAILATAPKAKRDKFLSNLVQRVQFTDQLLHERKQERQGQSPEPTAGDAQQHQQGHQQNQQQPQAAPPAGQTPTAPQPVDTHWNAIDTAWGKDLHNPLKAAVQGTVQQSVGPVQQQMAQLMNFHIGQQLNQVMNNLQLPEGIDAKDPKVQDQIKAAMVSDLRGRFVLGENDFTHSAPRVIATLFTNQIAAAQRQATNRNRQQAIRSTPEAGIRRQTTAPRVTEADREALAFQGMQQGLEGSALARFIDAGGAR